MATENHTDKSAPLAAAASLLSVCVSAVRNYDDPEHTSFEDLAKVICSARESLQAAANAEGFSTRSGAIFRAIDILVIAESYLLTEACLESGHKGESPVRSALEVAVELIERELEAGEGEPPAPGEDDDSAPGEIPQAA